MDGESDGGVLEASEFGMGEEDSHDPGPSRESSRLVDHQ